jgi:hypothetical protein
VTVGLRSENAQFTDIPSRKGSTSTQAYGTINAGEIADVQVDARFLAPGFIWKADKYIRLNVLVTLALKSTG